MDDAQRRVIEAEAQRLEDERRKASSDPTFSSDIGEGDFGVQAFKDRINAEVTRRDERENEMLQVLRDIRDDVQAIRKHLDLNS